MPTVATMNQPYNLPPEQLFECFERFLPAEPDPESCWIWRGANTGNGYGWLYIDGRRVRAHRFSYEIAHNIKLSPDVRVLPCVESRLCVNPAHATQQGERGRGHWSTLDHQRRAGDSPAGVKRRPPDGYCQAIWSQPVGSWQYRQSPRGLGPG